MWQDWILLGFQQFDGFTSVNNPLLFFSAQPAHVVTTCIYSDNLLLLENRACVVQSSPTAAAPASLTHTHTTLYICPLLLVNLPRASQTVAASTSWHAWPVSSLIATEQDVRFAYAESFNSGKGCESKSWWMPLRKSCVFGWAAYRVIIKSQPVNGWKQHTHGHSCCVKSEKVAMTVLSYRHPSARLWILSTRVCLKM